MIFGLMTPGEREKVTALLDERIKEAVKDGTTSKEELLDIQNIASKLKLSDEELNLKIQKAFAERLKSVIKLYAEDGKISEDEAKNIKALAQRMNISDDVMKVMIETELSNHKKDVRESVKNGIFKALAIGGTIAAMSVYAVIEINKSKNTKIVQHKSSK